MKFAEVKSIAEKFGKKILRNIELFDIYEDEKIGKDNKSYAVSFTFRDDTKTLQDTDIESIMKKLMEEYGAAYMAEGIVTLAGSRLYMSLADTDEVIDEALNRFERVFKNVQR